MTSFQEVPNISHLSTVGRRSHRYQLDRYLLIKNGILSSCNSVVWSFKLVQRFGERELALKAWDILMVGVGNLF